MALSIYYYYVVATLYKAHIVTTPDAPTEEYRSRSIEVSMATVTVLFARRTHLQCQLIVWHCNRR